MGGSAIASHRITGPLHTQLHTLVKYAFAPRVANSALAYPNGQPTNRQIHKNTCLLHGVTRRRVMGIDLGRISAF